MVNINFFSNVNTAPTKKIKESIAYTHSKEDLQRILDRLYQCRNLEITNLWQRSVFLSVFLILCFTAHGYLLFETIDRGKENSIQFLFLGFALSFIGIIMSVIWICMAKASKAWYEVYEEAITKLEHEHYRILGIPYEYAMGNMTIQNNDIDTNILSRHGGAFSPSKINIIIGQVCFFWWVLSGFYYLVSIVNLSIIDNTTNILISGIILMFIFLLLIFLLKFQSWVTSGFLLKK